MKYQYMYESVRRACRHLAVGPDDVRVADDGGGDGHAAVGFRQQHRVVTVVFALANLINNIYNIIGRLLLLLLLRLQDLVSLIKHCCTL